MKRLLVSIGIVVGMGIASMLAVSFFVPRAASAVSTNNFTIDQYDIKYELSKDADDRSVLKTIETITARFPQSNQNHGLERELPTKYDGHPTNLKISSVKTKEGADWQYSSRASGDVQILRIGDPDEYVHGEQTFVIEYMQRDVTRFYADTGRDEWYWDTNGVNWRVPIEQLNVSVSISSDLAQAFQGAPQCYLGAIGSKEQCSISSSGNGTYVASAENLADFENMTVAFGFAKGTFAPYQQSLWDKLSYYWGVATIVTGLLGFVALITMIVLYSLKRNRTKELHTVPVQYIPPKNTSPIVASQVITAKGSVFSAQLIDLAVRRVIEIIETKPAAFWSLAQYDIKLMVDAEKQLPEVREILEDMWGALPKAGDRLALSSLRNNTKYSVRTLDNDAKLKALVEGDYALREKSPMVSKFFYNWAKVLVVFGVLTLSIPLALFAGIVALLGYGIRPLTDRGLELRRYLLGLDEYIKVSETERLKFFQGPDTAEKVGEAVDVNDKGQIVKLYERVLPYAIIFGHEKKWTKQLGDMYESAQTAPSWYSGSTAFNAAVFASAMSSFSNAAAYSGGSSSSTGGSSGGGSSGGGGGGGGGGGW